MLFSALLTCVTDCNTCMCLPGLGRGCYASIVTNLVLVAWQCCEQLTLSGLFEYIDKHHSASHVRAVETA